MGKILERKTWHQRLFQYPDFIGDIRMPYLLNDTNGFLGRHRKVIYVDEYQYDNFVEKYRFTLAHEVGHFVMHESVYEGLYFDSEQEFMEWLQSRPRNELGWFETQANWFAGQLLVPTWPLQENCVNFTVLTLIFQILYFRSS